MTIHPHLWYFPPANLVVSFPTLTLETFLTLQLNRILLKLGSHASGPKKPSLAETDILKPKKKV